MANFTENDIVTYYQQRVDSLKAELERAQSVLDALRAGSSKGVAVAAGIKSAKPAIEKPRRGRRKSTVAAEATAPAAPSKKRAGRPKSISSDSLSAPSSYEAKLKMESKVAYALAKTGPAFKEDVTRVLNDLEPDADPRKLDKDVTVKLSSLFKKGRIKATREGRKYRYSL